MFEEQWNNLPVPTRVQLALRAGLEGKTGSQNWEQVSDSDLDALVDTINNLAAKHRERRLRTIRKTAKKLKVSPEYLVQTGQVWIQEGRQPTADEFTDWAREQHPRACKHYQAAWPLKCHNGRCANHIQFNKCCTSFFANTGICETGYFHPERIRIKKWIDFQRLYRLANRRVGKKLSEIRRDHE